MKHLANCTNTEFLKQALLIREPLRKWLERTSVGEIRARKPNGLESMTEEEQRKAKLAQARANTSDMFDAALQRDFDGTVNLLALATFSDPADFDENPLSDYLLAVTQMLNSQRVVDFFTLYL